MNHIMTSQPFTLSIHDGGIPHITHGNSGAVRATLRAKLDKTPEEITEIFSRVETSRDGKVKGRVNEWWWTLRKN